MLYSHGAPKGAKEGAGDLEDEQVKALAQNGGILCLHFFHHYLNPPMANLDDLIDHINYIADLVGIDYVALGGDYFPLDENFRRGHRFFAARDPDKPEPASEPLGPIAELDDITKLPNLSRRMVARGFYEEDIQKVLGGNLLRVFQVVFGG